MEKMKPNVPLLRKIQRAIRREPRRLDMGDWIVRHPDEAHKDDPDVIPPCNTTACIAGHAVILSRSENPSWFARVVRDLYNEGYTDVEDEAMKALNISTDQALTLFYADEWPRQFQQEYYKASAPKEIAKVACARIDQFIKDNR